MTQQFRGRLFAGRLYAGKLWRGANEEARPPVRVTFPADTSTPRTRWREDDLLLSAVAQLIAAGAIY